MWIIPIVIVGVLALAFFWLFCRSVVRLKRATKVGRWPTTIGKILELNLKRNGKRKQNGEMVTVRYQYIVNGQEYENDVLAHGYSSSPCDSHGKIYGKLQTAKHVEVRYDPVNPKCSVLTYLVDLSIQFELAFSIFGLVFLLGVSLFSWFSSLADIVLIESLVTR